jgi:hypothetical protein
MSQSLASAKKRRAPNEPVRTNIVVPQEQPSQNIQNSGLTLPQVIQLVDRRLITLEKFMNETKQKNSLETIVESNDEIEEDVNKSQLKEIVEEFDKRYEMLAEEIVNIKNIVLSLQSYTMEVNKVLYDEKNAKKDITKE